MAITGCSIALAGADLMRDWQCSAKVAATAARRRRRSGGTVVVWMEAAELAAAVTAVLPTTAVGDLRGMADD